MTEPLSYHAIELVANAPAAIQKFHQEMSKNAPIAPANRLETLLGRISEGSDEAVWEMLDRYSSNLRRVVRRHLPQQLQGKLDSEDLVQSVWRSFLGNRGELSWIKSVDELAAYLVGMARHKAKETQRHFTQRKGFDVRRETSPDQDRRVDHHDARHERPSQIIERRERWQQALERVGEHGQAIVSLRLSGMNQQEVADQLGISKAKVQRTLTALLQSVSV